LIHCYIATLLHSSHRAERSCDVLDLYSEGTRFKSPPVYRIFLRCLSWSLSVSSGEWQYIFPSHWKLCELCNWRKLNNSM